MTMGPWSLPKASVNQRVIPRADFDMKEKCVVGLIPMVAAQIKTSKQAQTSEWLMRTLPLHIEIIIAPGR